MPEDVYRHYGHKERPKDDLGKGVKESRKAKSQVSGDFEAAEEAPFEQAVRRMDGREAKIPDISEFEDYKSKTEKENERLEKKNAELSPNSQAAKVLKETVDDMSESPSFLFMKQQIHRCYLRNRMKPLQNYKFAHDFRVFRFPPVFVQPIQSKTRKLRTKN